MRLSSGHLFPIPITLAVEADTAIRLDQDIALCNSHNELLAVMTIEEIYEWNLNEQKLLGEIGGSTVEEVIEQAVRAEMNLKPDYALDTLTIVP